MRWETKTGQDKFPYFKNYIQTIYDYRLQAKKDKDTALVQVAKLLMNALSGKLGQRTFDTTKIITLDQLQKAGGEEEKLINITFGRKSPLHSVMKNKTVITGV